MRERQPIKQPIPGIAKLDLVVSAVRNQLAQKEADRTRLEELRQWKADHRSDIRYMGQY